MVPRGRTTAPDDLGFDAMVPLHLAKHAFLRTISVWLLFGSLAQRRLHSTRRSGISAPPPATGLLLRVVTMVPLRVLITAPAIDGACPQAPA